MSDNNQLVKVIEQTGIASTEVDKILQPFADNFQKAKAIVEKSKGIVVTDEKQTTEMSQARENRLELKRLRVDVEKTRKGLKEQSLREGKAIDGIANIVKALVIPVEEHLEKQEKFAELKRAERAAATKADRTEKLMKYTSDISLYNLDTMNDKQFNELLETLKAQHEARLAAEKKAEADRLAAIEAENKRQAEIEAENAKLKKEAEAKEKALEKERKAEAEKQAKIQAEANAKLEEERKKREAIEAEQRAKLEEENRKKIELEEIERKALLAPDKEKLVRFAGAIDMIRNDKLPAMKTAKAQTIVSEIDKKLAEVHEFIIARSNEL